MFLAVKNTGRCNKSCWYCSDCSPVDMDKERVLELYQQKNPNSMLLIGGEPMILGVDYYKWLLDNGVKFAMQTNLTLYNSEWDKVFTHPNFTGLSVSGDKEQESTFLTKLVMLQESTTLKPLVLVILWSKELALKWYEYAKLFGFPLKFNYLLPIGRLKGREISLSGYFDIMTDLVEVWDPAVEVEPVSSLYEYFRGSNTRVCPYTDCLHGQVDILSVEPDGAEFFCCALSSLRMTKEEFLSKHFSLDPNCLVCDYYQLCRGCIVRNSMINGDPSYCKSIKGFFDAIRRKANAR